MVQEFDGVEMVLVPAGCFMMGSGVGTSAPRHEQCVAEPFWIEVHPQAISVYNWSAISSCASAVP